jgi:hypothetical protein
MKMEFDSEKKLGRERSQVKPSFSPAFFLFLAESARHFVLDVGQIVPVAMDHPPQGFGGSPPKDGSVQSNVAENSRDNLRTARLCGHLKGGGRDA